MEHQERYSARTANEASGASGSRCSHGRVSTLLSLDGPGKSGLPTVVDIVLVGRGVKMQGINTRDGQARRNAE